MTYWLIAKRTSQSTLERAVLQFGPERITETEERDGKARGELKMKGLRVRRKVAMEACKHINLCLSSVTRNSDLTLRSFIVVSVTSYVFLHQFAPFSPTLHKRGHGARILLIARSFLRIRSN